MNLARFGLLKTSEGKMAPDGFVEQVEITEEEAAKKRRRVKLQAFGRPGHVKGYETLPDGLRSLIEESFALHDRIVQLDRAFASARDPDAIVERPANPVAAQMNLLQRAFNQKLG